MAAIPLSGDVVPLALSGYRAADFLGVVSGYTGKHPVAIHQRLPAFFPLRIYRNALNRAYLDALRCFKVTHALRALGWVDYVNLFAL